MSFIKGVVNGVAEGLDEFANATMGLPIGPIGLGIGGLAESASKLLGEAVEEAPKVVSEVEKGVEEGYEEVSTFLLGKSNRIETPTIRGKKPAPETSTSNSIYEKIDNESPNLSISRTFYDEQGKPFSRQDFYRGSDPHTHFEKSTQKEYTDHEHIFIYNENGQFNKKKSIAFPLDPFGW